MRFVAQECLNILPVIILNDNDDGNKSNNQWMKDEKSLRLFRSKSEALLQISQVLKVPLHLSFFIPFVSFNLVKAARNVLKPATVSG